MSKDIKNEELVASADPLSDNIRFNIYNGVSVTMETFISYLTMLFQFFFYHSPFPLKSRQELHNSNPGSILPRFYRIWLIKQKLDLLFVTFLQC